MIDESTKLERAIHVIKSLTDGTDPFTGEPYEENSLMNDPRMIRCFYFVIEILERYKAGNTIKYIDRKNLPYKFPSNLAESVKLPPEMIGVNTFSRAVNDVIDPTVCKMLTGQALNLQLKKMGILSEEKDNNGTTRTVPNEKSAEYGIQTELREFDGRTYEKVVFNDTGKKFLLEHLQEIMDYAG